MISLDRLASLPQVQWTLQHTLFERMDKLSEEVRELHHEIHFDCTTELLNEFADVCIVMASLQARGAFTEEKLSRAFDRKLSKLANIAGVKQ